MFEKIVFDLDGTLTDSTKGIINAVIYSSQKMKVDEPLLVSNLLNNIGTPLQEYLRIELKLKKSQVYEAVKYFRQYYGEKGIYENTPYKGIKELLMELTLLNKKLYVATAKLEKYALAVLKQMEVYDYFYDITGADEAGLYADKTYLLNASIEKNRMARNSKTVMIGDKYMDIVAAKNNKVMSVAVQYGFGTNEELISQNPDYLVKNVLELRTVLLN